MQRKILSLTFAGALAFSALGFAACGDDDDGGGGSGGGAATDESYAREMCTALSDYQEEFESSLTDLDPDASEEEMMENVASVFRDLANSIDDVNPPSDLQDAHEDMVASMEEAASAVEEGNLDQLNNMDTDVDPEIQERLSQAAAEVEECEGMFSAPAPGGESSPESEE